MKLKKEKQQILELNQTEHQHQSSRVDRSAEVVPLHDTLSGSRDSSFNDDDDEDEES